MQPTRTLAGFALALTCALAPTQAQAFCGTYVGSAGSALYNEVSEVAVVRDGKRSTLSLRNDVVGDVDDFALVVPVPSVLDEDEIHVLDHGIFTTLDDYSAPRLVEYRCDDFDADADTDTDSDSDTDSDTDADSDTDVDVEAEYVVGEYDVVILSATGGEGLESWLDGNGYAMPDDSDGLLQDYIDSGSFFLAAKVRQDAGIGSGDALSPLQLSYEQETVSLPIRIGTLSSSGVQDLIVYGVNAYSGGALSIANYPEVEIEDECLWNLDEHGTLGEFFVEQFETAVDSVPGAAWATEYAWGNGSCDPCTGDTPSDTELATLGYDRGQSDMFFTRLHLRYTPDQASQDLILYNSGLKDSRQERYIRHQRFLEDRWPICNQGYPDDPGSCDPDDTSWDPTVEPTDDDDDEVVLVGGEGPLGCAVTLAAPVPVAVLVGLLGLVGLRRRRD